MELLTNYGEYGIYGVVIVALVAVVRYMTRINKECQDTITTKLFEVVENNTKTQTELSSAVKELEITIRASSGRH